MQKQFKPPAGLDHLPQQLTPFVGRQQELTEITRLLSDPACRLLTLVGAGGIGKTRLALQCAADLLENFTDGVYFVPLQPLQSTDFLIPAIADALNIHLSGQQEPRQQLLNQLEAKKLLLLLDNFEHLLDGADHLTALLQAIPAVKLLITSRGALNLAAEWLFPLAGMPYPNGDQTDEVETYSAVQLFVGCAQRIRPDFSLAHERAEVVRICRLVEGTPLALELAASWVKTLSCADIAVEIQNNLNFLTSRQRGVANRHQSMKAVFNHSYALLSREEQAVFKRLAVFRGGFRRQVGERVAGASLVILSTLVDKSLLRWEVNGRYQIHELLRQYAAEQLVQSAQDVAQVYDLHCYYYTEFLWERSEALRGGRQREALVEIETELENIRAAWQWAVEQLKVEQIQKSVESLGVFYDFQGRYLEGVKAFERAIQQVSGQESSGQIAEAVGLNERYVREWLNAMVVGRVVDYDPAPKTYHLPAEHTAFLTRAAGANNLAFYSQYIGLFGTVEDKIIDCFFNGGGLPYTAFGRFHEIMAEDSGVNVVEPLLDTILPLVPGLTEKLQHGLDVIDVGCGRGRALERMAQTFPNSRFNGLDFSEEAIAAARIEAEKKGLNNLRFEVRDVARWNELNRYDLITTFDAIHDQAQPDRVLSNIFGALKPNGIYLMQDIAASSHVHHNFDHPMGSFLYTVSTMHCMTVSLAHDGAGLGTMWGKEIALKMLAQAGFTNTEVHQLPHDIANYYYISRK